MTCTFHNAEIINDISSILKGTVKEIAIVLKVSVGVRFKTHEMYCNILCMKNAIGHYICPGRRNVKFN